MSLRKQEHLGFRVCNGKIKISEDQVHYADGVSTMNTKWVGCKWVLLGVLTHYVASH